MGSRNVVCFRRLVFHLWFSFFETWVYKTCLIGVNGVLVRTKFTGQLGIIHMDILFRLSFV